jgi:hypothetical protein
MNALKNLVWGIGWGKLDVMVVDMPPRISDVQMSISQCLLLAGITNSTIFVRKLPFEMQLSFVKFLHFKHGRIP